MRLSEDEKLLKQKLSDPGFELGHESRFQALRARLDSAESSGWRSWFSVRRTILVVCSLSIIVAVMVKTSWTPALNPIAHADRVSELDFVDMTEEDEQMLFAEADSDFPDGMTDQDFQILQDWDAVVDPPSDGTGVDKEDA